MRALCRFDSLQTYSLLASHSSSNNKSKSIYLKKAKRLQFFFPFRSANIATLPPPPLPLSWYKSACVAFICILTEVVAAICCIYWIHLVTRNGFQNERGGFHIYCVAVYGDGSFQISLLAFANLFSQKLSNSLTLSIYLAIQLSS